MTRPISMLKKWIAPLHVCDFTEKLLHYLFSPWQPVKNYYVPVLSAISRLVNSLDSTRTGMFWFWKVGSPSTTALYIYQLEPTKGCSRSGKQRLWLCFCERN